MNEEAGMEHEPWRRWRCESDDIVEQARMLPHWEQACVQLECGRFESIIDGVSIGDDLSLFRKRTNRRLHEISRVPADTCAAALLAPESDAILFQGQHVRAGDVLVVPPGGAFDIVTLGAFDVVVAMLSTKILPPAHGLVIDRRGAILAACAATRRLTDTMQKVLAAVDLEQPSRRRQLRMQLECHVIDCMSIEELESATRPSHRDDSALMAAARRLLLADAQPDGQAPRVSELAEQMGVSVRQLHKLFQARVGMPPRAYAERVRLARARSDLRESPPGATTVAAVATRWGFGHLGRFSSLYRAVFGELPSQTART